MRADRANFATEEANGSGGSRRYRERDIKPLLMFPHVLVLVRPEW